MKKEYGKVIDGLIVQGRPANYGVVNENAIRASAGLMFAIAFGVMIYTIMSKDLSLVKIVVPVYWLSFFFMVLVGPNWSIFAFAGEFLTKGKRPEYVGAMQKRFAWSMGLFMATVMMLLLFVFNITGIVPLILCGMCVLFMWLESACGFCVGCVIFAYLRDRGIIKVGENAPACAGGVCSKPSN